jgi:endo-1,4-beta-xylanase
MPRSNPYLTDRFTWIATSRPRRDGLPVRPLLYDPDLNPKPSWGPMHWALEMAPPRNSAT